MCVRGARSCQRSAPAAPNLGACRQAGDAHNVIPHEVRLGGTIRALSTERLGELRERLEEVLQGVGESVLGS